MPPAAKAMTVRQFFGRKGLLSEWHPNYEFREGQLQMAEAVEAALHDKKHLIVEAGTGTGKTLAYLVPAILSGRRVVISTGTKNLQEQLFYKDVPFLEKHLGAPLRVCYMKGRANYACRQKIYDAETEPVLTGLEEVADFQIIRDWEKSTETGDRAEIKTLPESSSAWAKIEARGDLCTGQKCQQFERCFITKMHQKAQESDIIIVNHHLLFADLAVKREDLAGIIPEYYAVIFDEAHDVEDVAGQYFGVAVSSYQFEELTRDVSSIARRKEFGSVELDNILMILGDRAQHFFNLFVANEGRTGFRAHEAFLELNNDAYHDVLHALELVSLQLELLRFGPEETIPLVNRARDMARRLEFWMDGKDRTFVYWIERRGRGTFLQATPIDVSKLLDERLFDKIDTVVLTSATLAVAGDFEFAKRGQLRSPERWSCRATSIIRSAGIAVHPAEPARSAQPCVHGVGGKGDNRDSAFEPRPRFRAVHQLSADAPDLRSRIAGNPLETLMQGTGPRSALLSSSATPDQAVRDVEFLARRRRAGRAIELRYY